MAAHFCYTSKSTADDMAEDCRSRLVFMRKLHHHQTARVRDIDGLHRRMVLKQRNAGSRVLEWLMCSGRGAA